MLHHLMKPIANAAPSRRSFLKLSAGAAGGLLIGLRLPGASGAAMAAEGELAQPFVHIRADNTVTVIVKHLDKGQGAATGLATLVADELDATHEQVRVEFAPADAERYKNLFFGVQGTGGSTAIANSFQQYRTAGATAKAMLVAAAAKAWGVPAAEIAVSKGELSHASGRKASFGEMAGLAAAESLPESPRLKTPEEWVFIGKSFPRLDTKMKTVGAPGVYGIDHKAENMLVAVVAHPPKFGAKPKTVDAAAAREVPGVVDVLTLPAGVAVLADKTWPAIRARELLEITWDETEAETRGSEEMLAELQAMAARPGLKAHVHGDAEAGLAGAATVIEAEYSFPFLAHAPMEPLDVTILFDGGTAEFWTGSQLQTVDQNVAAAVLGITPDKVAINTLWAGGSFGRRAQPDSHPIDEAAHIAKAWAGAGNTPRPIKVVWTREDDIKGGYYRPMVAHKVRAGIDAEGNITGWQHRVASKSILIGSPFEAFLVKDGVDETTAEGITDMTYAAGAIDVEVHNAQTAVPVLWWRSVGHTHTAYVVETMIDRLAKAAGKDPVAFREGLLKDDPRKLGVLRLAAEKAGWNDPLPEGRHRGVAVHKSFNTYVAEVAEISFRDDGTVKVEKVTCAVDCGVPVNPDNIRAQMEGGIGYGLGAILRNEITMTDGEVDQSNFDAYLPLRISDMPQIEVHVVPSTEAPTGAGEPGTPPIGPAVANAIAAAKGEWITALPLSKQGLA
ncbi:xanthine dehydrogenase family protein molybdopterin-binding subunit [Stappia sp. F7233]|uniref:Xanthine dehydrogenase family protein molybdopterin-binding subunit n=1 Tax=Stappia albiluteola TaxID=2758565 RepID=A0A839AHL9_9HYPH|nr:xanthine dehydrogenase family protein molybdopterin-binding subunit [Stappia albiluteola]MBA5778576.1 xanthine dehydrogenase family protein molybdopterin-binding subunit [Stappia albiluteola]